MWTWLVENGLKILWKVIWIIVPVTGWFVLNNYRLGESLAATQENKAAIQKLREDRDQDRKELSDTLQEIQRALGRIEGALGTR